MDLRQLRYFVAVAEELNFTRAALKLGMAQPPLSQQIMQLERQLGGRLFERNRNGVALTEIGEALFPDAVILLRSAAVLEQKAQLIASGSHGSLKLGFTVSASFHPVVPGLIRTFRQSWPDVHMDLVENTTVQLFESVRVGAIDVAFVRTSASPDQNVVVETLLGEPMLVAVPSTHRAANQKTIALESLAEETFIFYPRTVGVGLYRTVVNACEAAGFKPIEGIEAPQLTSVITFVAAGMGISVIPATMSQLQAEGVAYLEIEGASVVAELAIAHRRKPQSTTLQAFLRLVSQELGTS